MLQIDELQIRVPGMNEEQGTGFGKLVAEKVAAGLPDNHTNQRIPAINIQLKDSFSPDTNLMADRIADQIIRQIKLAII